MQRLRSRHSLQQQQQRGRRQQSMPQPPLLPCRLPLHIKQAQSKQQELWGQQGLILVPSWQLQAQGHTRLGLGPHPHLHLQQQHQVL
jgi:hypothetical protein